MYFRRMAVLLLVVEVQVLAARVDGCRERRAGQRVRQFTITLLPAFGEGVEAELLQL